VVKYETHSCRTALKLRVRARNVGEMCAGEMDDLQGDDDAEKRWEEACRREEAIRDLLSRSPDGLKGRDVTDLAWELGSAALRPTE
jgi:putative transposase